MEIHGGPNEAVWERFAPELQLWVDHGFALFAVNYRGSVGFGRAFQEQILGNPGHWEQEDIVAGRNWLIQQGIARQDAILITGWSYGGYLTLLALGKFPDLWVGGMAGYAIADYATLHDEVAEGLELTWLFGGTPQEKPEQYRISSPITSRSRLRCSSTRAATTAAARLSKWSTMSLAYGSWANKSRSPGLRQDMGR